MFVDSATGKLSVQTNTGVTVDLESVGTPAVAAVLPDASTPPTSGKWGAFWGGAHDGTGMMAGVKNYGNAAGAFTSTTSYTNFTSDAADDEQAGFITNNGITRLDKNPYIKFVVKTPIITERFWAGVSRQIPWMLAQIIRLKILMGFYLVILMLMLIGQ